MSDERGRGEGRNPDIADDLEQIRRLKYRYLRLLDTKQWDDFERCFVPSATGDYAGLVFDDRAALVGYMREHLAEGVITVHHCHHPEIDVAADGETATATWYLEDKVLVPAFRYVLEGAAFYEDRYVRTDEGWRIAHTGYRRTYEATWSMDAVEGYTVTERPLHS